jgi:hypothetical protein
MTWYKKGEEGIKEKVKQDKLREERASKTAHRFWLKEGNSAKIMFLEDEGFFCYVHQLKVDGNWNNFATCVRDIKPCPICEAGKDYKPIFTGHYSIIDFTPYEKKDGTKVKYTRKILPAKGSAIMRLHDLRKKYGKLKGLIFEVKRYSSKEPNCGGTFDYDGKITKSILESINKDDLKPFNFEEVLAPPTDEEYAALGFAPVEFEGAMDTDEEDTSLGIEVGEQDDDDEDDIAF